MTATFQFIHDLGHRIMGLDYPHGHWLINVAATLLFVVAPGWTLWIGMRLVYRRYSADSDEAAHLFRYEVAQVFQSEAAQGFRSEAAHLRGYSFGSEGMMGWR